MQFNIRWAIAGLVVAVRLAACGAPGGAAVRVEDAWARPALAGGSMPASGSMTPRSMAPGTGAVFCILTNTGRQADRLVGATSDAAQAVEIHQTTMEGDVMRMAPVPGGIEIPAGGRVELKPGGYHIMLIGLVRDLSVGDRVTVVLQFETGRPLTVEAVVKEP